MKSIYGAKLDECTELNEWFERVKKEVRNYEEANGQGATAFGTFISALMKENEKKL